MGSPLNGFRTMLFGVSSTLRIIIFSSSRFWSEFKSFNAVARILTGRSLACSLRVVNSFLKNASFRVAVIDRVHGI